MDTTDWKTIWILPLVWLAALAPPYMVAASMGTGTMEWVQFNNMALLVVLAGIVAQVLLISLPWEMLRLVLPVTGGLFFFFVLRVVAAHHQAETVAIFWSLIFVTGAVVVVGLLLWGVIRVLMSLVLAVRNFVNSVVAVVVRTTRFAVAVGIVLLCMYGGKAIMDIPREGVRPVAPGGRVAAWALGVLPNTNTNPVWVDGRIHGTPAQGTAGTGYGGAGSTPIIVPERTSPQLPPLQVNPNASPEELERLGDESMLRQNGDFDGYYEKAASAYMERWRQSGNPRDYESYGRCSDPRHYWRDRPQLNPLEWMGV